MAEGNDLALSPEAKTAEIARRLQLPECEHVLREKGFAENAIQEWLQKLSTFGLSDEQLVQLVLGQPLSGIVPSKWSKQLTLMRHRFSHLLNHGRLSVRLLYVGSWSTLLLGAILKAGLGWWGWLTGLIVLVIKLRSLWREIDPVHLPVLQRTHNERNYLLERLILTIQLWQRSGSPPNSREIDAFRVDVLKLIASYARDHRSDLAGKSIFVNLLVRQGDRIAVIARSDTNRQVPQLYSPEECSVAWATFQDGQPHACGDLQREHPNGSANKRYKSILTVAIKLNHRVLGVVSIDSESAYHFEGYERSLPLALAPYVQLLASSLNETVEDLPSEDHATHAAPKESAIREGAKDGHYTDDQ
jgi:hypothetical protein